MKKTAVGIGAVVLAVGLGVLSCQSTAPIAGRPPRLTALKGLVTVGGGTAMTPDFSPEVTDYSLSVQSDITAIGIAATAGPGARETLLVGTEAVRPGETAIVDVAVGDNVIPVTLTGADGTTVVYQVHVNREDIKSVVDGFLKASYSDPSTAITMGYRLFVPADFDPTKAYPLVFFLHGAGERGSDNEAQLISSQGATVWAKPDEQAKHPAFILAPQCPGAADSKQDGWTTLMTKGVKEPYTALPELETAYDLLEEIMGKYSIDRNRIYCTGISMGAFGAWALAVEHPDVFAAMVVASGGGDPARLPAVAKMPVWVFHAVKDPTIPVSFAKTTVKALTDAGGSPKYTEYPADAYFYPVAHVSWVPGYANAEMRDWLFSQSRK